MDYYEVYIRIYDQYPIKSKLLSKTFDKLEDVTEYVNKLKVFIDRIYKIISYIDDQYTKFGTEFYKTYPIRYLIFCMYEDLLNYEHVIFIDNLSTSKNTNIDWFPNEELKIIQNDKEIFTGSYRDCKSYLNEHNITNYHIIDIDS